MKLLATYRAEVATGCAWLAGWALCTAAIDRHSLWLGSAGLLCLSIGGWRLLYVVLRDGLYLLSRGEK